MLCGHWAAARAVRRQAAAWGVSLPHAARASVFSKSLVLQTDLGVTTLYDHLSHTWDEHPLQG